MSTYNIKVAIAIINNVMEDRYSTVPHTATRTVSIKMVKVAPEIASLIFSASTKRLRISPVFLVSKKRIGRFTTWS